MRLIIYFILILFFFGCECPPNLNTDKDYVPKENSYLCILNLLNNAQPYNVYSMNIKIQEIKQIPKIHYQNYFKFQAGTVDFKVKNSDSILLNTIVQTQKSEFYTMLLYRSKQDIENVLIWENIDKSKNNLYLRFANYSNIDKLKIVLISDLPQNLEYNLLKNGLTENIAFPSIPLTIQFYQLPDNKLITKIENLSINLGNIAYFILTGDTNQVEVFQIVNNYKVN